MLSTIFLSLTLASLRVIAATIPAQGQSTAPPTPASPQLYSPTDLRELCHEKAYYCIYVDQIRPGTVHASPVSATDAQGAFLFERANYMEHPFHVCFGGCCVDLDFAVEQGCVHMSYVSRPSDGPGHLLARFADNVENIIGPQESMYKNLTACPEDNTGALPYAVIGARSKEGKKKKPGQQDGGNQAASGGAGESAKLTSQSGQPAQPPPPNTAGASSDGEKEKHPFHNVPGVQPGKPSPNQSDKSKQIDPAKKDDPATQPGSAYTTAKVGTAAKASPPRGHDYFEDVTVPIFDA